MTGTRRKELLDGFLPALRQAEVKRRAPAAPVAVAEPVAHCMVANTPARVQAVSNETLLQALIVPGSWFRIADASTNRNRWMKAVTYYQDRGTVTFAEFNGRNSLFIKMEQFFDGLCSKNIEPLELMPVTKDLLERYLLQK